MGGGGRMVHRGASASEEDDGTPIEYALDEDPFVRLQSTLAVDLGRPEHGDRTSAVEQNLLGVMELLNMDRATRRRRCDELLEQFGIAKLRRSKAGTLSGGERRRLEIARCLVSDPEIILLDEPFTGIDPVTIQGIQDIIKGLRDRGIGILLTDHREMETLTITDRNYIICAGRVLVSGDSKTVLSNED